MIEWLNDNSGAVMALLTAVYVVCTLVLCVFAHRSTKVTRQLHLDVQRPCVVCDFVTIHTVLYFRIRNLGPQSAQHVKIDVTADPPSSYNWGKNPAIMDGISLLSPGQELVFLYQGPCEPAAGTVVFSISYKDAAGRRFSETYANDLSAFGMTDLGRENNDPVVKALREIGQQLKRFQG